MTRTWGTLQIDEGVGSDEGLYDGSIDGFIVGGLDGVLVGELDGLFVGDIDGAWVGGMLTMRKDTVFVTPLVPLALVPEYGVADTIWGCAEAVKLMQV